MKNLKVLIALIVVGLLLNPTIAPAQTEIRFDKGNFETAIRRNFNGRVMGYQVILLKKGQIVSEMADGLARNPADGNVKMTIDTPANIGSTAKFFAGTALLQKFQKTNEMDLWLGKEVYKFFPKIWQDEMDDSIKQIRFRDLLQHEGGFIHNDPDPTIKVYFDYLRKGVTSDQTQPYAYGKRNYANANITTIGYVLVAIDNPLFLNMVNKKIADQNLKANDPAIEALLGQGFENYMKAKIFSQINPAISPSCDAPNEYPKKNIVYAKMYNLPTTATPGAEFSSKAKIGACHAAGGWYVTGRELATYVANYAASDEIITKPTRDLMFDDDDAKERLVWSMVEPDGSLLKNFGWNTSPYMGGDHPVGSSKAHATIVKLPNDYYAVGIINSDILNTQGQPGGSRLLTQNIIEAFKAAVAANF